MAPSISNPSRNLFAFILICLFALVVETLASGPYSLTTTAAGSGNIARNPNFPQYPDGSTVTLTANPAPDWLFSHWTGDLSGSANPINIQMDGPRSVTAHFVETPIYTLSTTVNGEGSITLNPPGASYRSNSVVQLTADPATGWTFISWSGDASGSANPLSLTVRNDKSITAAFAELVTIINPPGNVLTNSGSTVQFSVQARGSGPLTYQWKSLGGDISGATNSTLTLKNVQAANEGRYTVTVTGPHNGVTASAVLALTDSACSGGPGIVNEPREDHLRSAIARGGYIRLCVNGTITLTQPITIAKDVVLDAAGRLVSISGNNTTRIFNVQTNITFAITNITLTEGRHRGSDHPAAGRPGLGGAILNSGGTVILTHCTLTNNVAIGGKGTSSDSLAPGGLAAGAAIFNDSGTLKIYSTTIASNLAIGGGGSLVTGSQTLAPAGHGRGGAIASTGGDISIVDSAFNRNLSSAGIGGTPAPDSSGGAIFLENTTASIDSSSFATNTALGIDGPAFGTGGDSAAPTAARGGAIRTLGGTLAISNTDFIGNLAEGGSGSAGRPGAGGAIFSEGPVSLRNSSFESNRATGGTARFSAADGSGGAWHNAANGSSASESLFYQNRTDGGNTGQGSMGNAYGGAIANTGTLFLTNSTAALNVAVAGENRTVGPLGAGLSQGGAISNTGTNASLATVNVTLAANAVTFVNAGIFFGTFRGANVANSGGTVTLRNTILAYPNGTNSNAYGPITDAGHNISSDASADFNSGTSFNLTDPRLEPLADNGGPTLTMALRPNSPAIDFASTNAPPIDQRGFSRPSGSGVDIGAFEYAATAHFTPNLGIQLQSNGSVLIWFVDGSSNIYELQSSTNLLNWQTLETFSGTTPLSREYPADASARFFRVINR